MAPKYTLKYFNVRAFGEVCRQTFALAGVDFEDVRYDRPSWAENPERLNTPFGKLPVLEFDGKQIPESHSIARYIAKLHGLAGKDDYEEAVVNGIADAFKDYVSAFFGWGLHAFTGLQQIFPNPPGTKEGAYEQLKPARDRLLGGIEKYLKVRTFQLANIFQSSTSGFLVSGGVTWVDLLVTENLATGQQYAPDYLDGHDDVKAWVERVRGLPRIKAFLTERKETPVDC